MSRYRNDRDEYYGGRPSREYEDERRQRGRGEGYGESYGGGERTPLRRDVRDGERGYEDYGRGRDYRDRDYPRGDYETGAVGRRGERRDYNRERYYDERERYRDERDRRDFEDDREGRSIWEEGREYFRRGFGGTRRGRTARSHLRCRDIMTRDVTVATRDTTLERVARMMRDEDTGIIPVVDRDNTPIHTGGEASGERATTPVAPLPTEPVGESPEARRINADIHGNGRLVGLITDRDIVIRAVAEGKDARAVRADEIMTTDIHTAHPNDRVIDAVRKMGDKQVRRIPVIDRDGTLRGIISMADVALETDDDRELAEALEEISSGHSFWNRIFG